MLNQLLDFLNSMIAIIAHPFPIMLMGLVAHFGRKVLAAGTRENARPPCFADYWQKNPIQSVLAFVGAIAGYSIFAHYPNFYTFSPDLQLSIRVTAFGIGYMSDNIADAIGDKVINKIKAKAE